jgi:hypothetical protein
MGSNFIAQISPQSLRNLPFLDAPPARGWREKGAEREQKKGKKYQLRKRKFF